MLFLVDRFMESHPEFDGPIDPDTVASWAIETGLYNPPPIDEHKLLRARIRTALRDDYFEDPQGRSVRSHQPEMFEVGTTQGLRWRSRWHKTYEMPPEKMRAAGQLRRRGALRDVVQIQIDFDSYNDNNKLGAHVDQLDYNFNKDLLELSQPIEYSDEGPTIELEDEDEEIFEGDDDLEE